MSTPKPLHIFRPGCHTAMSGAAISFSESDLQATCLAYDPAKWRAPLVVGHPRVDAPAYGWVDSVEFSEIGIEATPGDVETEFAELVNAKRFSSISVSFWAPAHPSNPVPGVYYLRHVGFLGAVPPALKGLRTPEFAADDEGIVEFSAWDDAASAGLWRRLREWVLGKFGADEADQVVPSYLVEGLERAAQREIDEELAEDSPPAPPQAAAFSDPSLETSVTPEEKARLEAENAALRARLDAADAEARTRAATERHAANVAFADGLVTAGRLPPAHRDVVVATLDCIASQPEPVEFGEGDAKAPLLDAVRGYLQAAPVAPEFAEEVATNARAAGGDSGTVSFAAPRGYHVDGDSAALRARALDYQTTHPGVDFVTAVTAVSNA